MSENFEDKYIEIGKVSSANGIKGEVQIYSYSEERNRFETVENFYDREGNLYKRLSVRYKKDIPIVLFDGIDDRDKAEALKGREIFVKREDLPPLEDGVYYIRDMIGMEVVDEKLGRIGVLSGVRTDTPQRIYIVKRNGGKGEVLIPGVEEFIKNIDIYNRIIRVSLIEGMI